jgi:hypothetical protein
MAYCLLGLFDINMPLLYGEGAVKAFVRLQLEILKKTGDDSIFAWLPDENDSHLQPWHGLLAPSPSGFKWANTKDRHVRRAASIYLPGNEPLTVTYRRLELSRPVQTVKGSLHNSGYARELFVYWLQCNEWEQSGHVERIPILLTSFNPKDDFGGYVRAHDFCSWKELRKWLTSQKCEPVKPKKLLIPQQGL